MKERALLDDHFIREGFASNLPRPDHGTRLANYIIDRIASAAIAYGLLMITGSAILFLVSLPLYYLLMELILGKTIGKFLTRTTVVTETLDKLEFHHALGRTVSRLMPFEQLSFLGGDARGWHDTWTKTYVVYDDDL